MKERERVKNLIYVFLRFQLDYKLLNITKFDEKEEEEINYTIEMISISISI